MFAYMLAGDYLEGTYYGHVDNVVAIRHIHCAGASTNEAVFGPHWQHRACTSLTKR
jgi:hypothetical protein